MDPRPTPELFQTALKLQFSGQLAEAEPLYREILARNPNHPEATHFLGVLAHQVGKLDLAEEIIRRSIQLNPNVAGFHNNLGEILRTRGKDEEALQSYKRAVQLEPKFVEAYSNIGVIMAKRQQYDESKLWLLQALRLRPDFVPALHLLGGLLMETGKSEDAKVPLKRVLELQPDHAEGKYLYAAASGGADAPPAPPTPYIAGVFDGYADHFDEHLVNDLAYRVPQLLRAAVDRARPDGATFDILDLGCGTGLTGAVFKGRAKTLHGVDVSPGMIDQAK